MYTRITSLIIPFIILLGIILTIRLSIISIDSNYQSAPVSTSTPQLTGKIAFVSDRDGNDEIYVMNADGSNQVNLTKNDSADRDPIWSPDGSKIAFTSDRNRTSSKDFIPIEDAIYIMNADGSNQKLLTSNISSLCREFSWSPDSSKIAFVSFNEGNYEIYTMNADGSNQKYLTNNSRSDYSPVWSPDGKKIAFISNRDTTPPYEAIYIMSADGSNQTRLTEDNAIYNNLQWSASSNKIVFLSKKTDMPFEIYLIKEDGFGNVLTCNSSSTSIKSIDLSVDGKIAFLSDSNGYYGIHVIDTDGKNETRLTMFNIEDCNPVWSPDGKNIAYVSDLSSNSDIYIIKSDGTGRVKLTNNISRDSNPVWSPR
jgi:Tol biopolymer transport system component